MSAAVAAAKRGLPTLLSFYGRLRSIPCSLGRSVRRTESEAGRAKADDMIKLHGIQPFFRLAPNPYARRLPEGYDSPAPLVIAEARELERKPDISIRRYSTSSSNANADAGATSIFLKCFDEKGLRCFTVSSLEEDGSISPKSTIYPPSPLQKGCAFVGATFNGLFHFHNCDNWDDLLWNSKTNEIKTLPKVYVAESDDSLDSFDAIALCSSSSQQDYKLLQLLKTHTLDEKGNSKICINEVCYCKAYIAAENDEEDETVAILSFDFSTETLSSLPLPPNTSNYYILDYKGFLSVAVYSHDEKVPSKYELWVMIGGSWTRETVLNVSGVHQPVWFSKNGRLLYFEGFNGQVVVYDRDVGKFKNLGHKSYFGSLRFYPYGESSLG